MKKSLLCVLACVAGAVVLAAQEKIVLTTPVFVSAGKTEFRVWSLILRRAHPDRPAGIVASFREVNGSGFVAEGKDLECAYEGAAAESLVIALNKMNLSTTSLERRIIERCQADGKIGAGAISGSPQ
jgi:hypothetical protein